MEIIQILTSVFTAFVAAGGFALTIKRLWSNNERSKGELAVVLLCEWSNYVDLPMSNSVRLASKIGAETDKQPDERTIHKIWNIGSNEAELTLPKALYAPVVDILSHQYSPEDLPSIPSDESFVISPLHVGYIEFQWTKYFNRLEATLSAWQQGYADQKMMTKQFQKLLHLKWQTLNTLLAHKDDAACFPVTRYYLEELNQEKEKYEEEEDKLTRLYNEQKEGLQRERDEVEPRNRG